MDLIVERQPQIPVEGVATDCMPGGIVTSKTNFNFSKAPGNGVDLKQSDQTPTAYSIIRPDFKFELGIGGLDWKFSAIFHRAFVSRICPPGLIDKVGIQHVK